MVQVVERDAHAPRGLLHGADGWREARTSTEGRSVRGSLARLIN